ncbi:MAG: hypothetical protein NC483_05260 [Ruminococcus sp.]|nr:hypothetical protein [Ruminococcus sp.]
MKKTNILFIIWGIVVLGIVICLTVLGFMLKKINREYQELERSLQDIAIIYVKDKALYPEENDELKISKDELLENGYLGDLKVDSDTCNGYVIVKLEEGFTYNSYIKCKRYTTKGY